MEARVAVMAKLTQHIHPSALFSLSKSSRFWISSNFIG